MFSTLLALSCHDCRQCHIPPRFHQHPPLWLRCKCSKVCFLVLDQITSISTTSNSFDSLFRVLFIFPSQYLFAIGFPSLFSLRWSIPPILSCTLKQLDSFTYNSLWWPTTRYTTTGVSPSMLPLSIGLGVSFRFPNVAGFNTTSLTLRPNSRLGLIFPFHSPLLWKSLLFSFPPLIKMLQFSGCTLF